jgi:hypothetical protein
VAGTPTGPDGDAPFDGLLGAVKVTIHRPELLVSATRKIGFGLCGELLVTHVPELQKVPVKVTNTRSPVNVADPTARLRADT